MQTCGNIASRTNRAECIYGIRTYQTYLHINIYIDNFPFSPQVWGSLRSPQLSMSADATCSTMESYSNSSARVPESSGNREDRLQRRRERERARRASETAEQREERLRVRRARDRARRAAQTAEERDARLRQRPDNPFRPNDAVGVMAAQGPFSVFPFTLAV